jgi:multiple sugar transport system permease protein
MNASKAMREPPGLRGARIAFLGLWILVACFPLAWIAVMSVKLPVDAFDSSFWRVVSGPRTLQTAGGWSILDIVLGIAMLSGIYHAGAAAAPVLARVLGVLGGTALGWALAAIVVSLAALGLVVFVMPALLQALDGGLANLPALGVLAEPVFGFTARHYVSVWVGHGFTRNFINSMIVTTGVVTISLTVGTLAGYALARTKSSLAFWLLITALIFRALPHSVLVTGYLPPFISSREWLMPIWHLPVLGDLLQLVAKEPPTLYGQPWAVIFVLVSINQPFTIWMLRSFFETVPAELDEAARVDGCSHFEAFRRVIMPVMWPGVITTGLFSFLLAYNDYLVCALLLDAQSQTMVPAITQYFNRETTATDQIEAIAAAVSITAPLFVLVMVFQRQIVSGLTAGAVKG